MQNHPCTRRRSIAVQLIVHTKEDQWRLLVNGLWITLNTREFMTGPSKGRFAKWCIEEFLVWPDLTYDEWRRIVLEKIET